MGLRAGLAVLASRPTDVLRVAYGRAVRDETSPAVRACEARGIVCEELPEAELKRIAGDAHHEGFCVLARPRPWLGASELAERLVGARGACVAMDRVRNPYNVGAVLRSAAFFGVDAVLVGAPAPHAGLSPLAVRVAEGGAETVPLARTTDLGDTLSRLRTRGVRVVGADGHADRGFDEYAFVRPTVLVLGHEREGLSPRIRGQCDAVVAIRGSGRVESLNVAVAAGILIGAMTRRSRGGG